MKTTLTTEESARLIELGIDPKLASKEVATTIYEREYNDPRHPIFTLTDILSILPKEIILDGKHLPLGMEFDEDYMAWTAYYLGCGYIEAQIELIDALYQLLIWCVEQGYVKN